MTMYDQVWDYYSRVIAGVRREASRHDLDAHVQICFRADDGRARPVRITSAPDGSVKFYENGVEVEEIEPIIETMGLRLQACEDARKGLFSARDNYRSLRAAIGTRTSIPPRAPNRTTTDLRP